MYYLVLGGFYFQRKGLFSSNLNSLFISCSRKLLICMLVYLNVLLIYFLRRDCYENLFWQKRVYSY